MADQFKGQSVSRDSPAVDWFPITPTNGVDIPRRPRFIYVGVAGNVHVHGDSGEASSVILSLPVGWHPISPVRIPATGTTASGIVGFV